MENNTTQTKIRHLAKTLSVFCCVLRVILCVTALLSLLGAALACLAPQLAEPFFVLVEQNTLFLVLQKALPLDALELRYAGVIGFVIAAVTLGVLSLTIRFFQKLLLNLMNSGKPFSLEAARSVRRFSYLVLLTLLYNPLVGVLAFLMVWLFSYLVEYGAFLQEKADQTNQIQEEIIVSFAEITENKSGQTGQHIRRVSEYTRALALEMGYPEGTAQMLALASTMHDIGKLLIPSEILEKPGKLTQEEYEKIKEHTTYGGALLHNVQGEVMHEGRTIALEHHERPDGRGYPAGKKDISIEGRMVAVADVYDALTSRRSYKEAWAEDQAYEEILQGSGTQFDAQVVEAFKRAYPRFLQIREKFQDAQ